MSYLDKNAIIIYMWNPFAKKETKKEPTDVSSEVASDAPPAPKKRKLFSEHPEVDKDIDRAIFMVRHGAQLKVLVVVIVILIIAGIAGYFIYKAVVPPPECTLDEHCDEGYYCHEEKCIEIPVEKPPENLQIQVEETGVFPSVDGRADVMALVKDPDARWGLQEMGYIFSLKDSSGNEVGSYEGVSYILPGEEKYLVRVGVPVSGTPSSVDVTIEPRSWVKSPQLQQPNIEVKNLAFSREANVGQAQLDGRLINSSKYNFEEVEVTAVLEDSSGEAVAVNYTTLNALFAGEERDFRMLWFSEINGDVAAEDVRVEADVYNTENFLLEMQTEPELFQLYEEPEED